MSHCHIYQIVGNYPKCSNFEYWHFPPIFVRSKVTCLVTLFDSKLQVFIFGIFSELLPSQNVNVARFVRNVECDFFCDFQTLCVKTSVFASLIRPETN